jgi:hypothetical protein
VARTRMIKPDLRTSEKVAGWPREVRYFWVLLWGYLDDYGRGKDNPRLIKADCFPLDDDVTAETIDAWLWVIAGDGVIIRYGVEGDNFIASPNWDEHQKPQHPTASKIPDHTGFISRVNDSRTIPETLTPSLVKSGFSSGVVKSGSSPAAVTESFDACYSHWPKKVRRKEALEKFRRAARVIDPSELADHVIRFGDAYAATTERQYVPALDAWLNGERWTDELPVGKRTKADETLDVLEMGRRMQEAEDRKALT